MLQNAYLLAKIGADTAENERKFAEIFNFAKNWQLPYGPGPSRCARGGRGDRRSSRRPATRSPRAFFLHVDAGTEAA